MKMMEQPSPEGQSQVVELDAREESPLEDLLRRGARQMLLTAIEAEVEDYLARHAHERDAAGRRLVTRNGQARQRTLLTALGPLRLQTPRVEDRRVGEDGKKIRFTSAILPP